MKRIPALLLIFVLSFSVRLAFISNNQRGIESDEAEYDRLAMAIVESRGYVNPDGSFTSHRPPLYPAFLAVTYRLFGHNYLIVRIIQALFSAFTACIFYLIAEKVFNRPTALVAGIISAFYMIFTFYTNFLLTETFFSFLLAIVILAVISTKGPGVVKFSLLGLLCALLTLLRSSGFFVPLIAAATLWARARKGRIPAGKTISSYLALFLCFGLALLPWTIRNYRAHGSLVPVSTNGGLNIYQAIRPVDGKIFELGPRDEVARKAKLISNEAERSDFYLSSAIRAYREEPRTALKLLVMRFLFFWNFIDWNVTDGVIINYHYIFILPFFVFGAALSIRNRKEIFPIFLTILYFTSLVCVFQGFARFRMPIDGYIIILGSYGICEFINKTNKKIYPILATGSYLFVTYILYRHSLDVKYFVRDLMKAAGLWF